MLRWYWSISTRSLLLLNRAAAAVLPSPYCSYRPFTGQRATCLRRGFRAALHGRANGGLLILKGIVALSGIVSHIVVVRKTLAGRCIDGRGSPASGWRRCRPRV